MNKETQFITPPGKVYRLLWTLIWALLCRWLPRSMGSNWKRFILNLFGAKIEKGAIVYSGAKIYCPYNLIMKRGACLDMGVNCYNVSTIILEEDAVVSQGTFLCTASHDYTDPRHPLIGSPITLCKRSWVAAQAFIGVGVTVGEGAVVGARTAVFKNVEPWTVIGGNPAKYIKNRVLQFSTGSSSI